MSCDVCGSDNQVRHLTNLYTIGSEGTRLCNDCCIAVSNFVRSLSSLATRKEKQCYLKWKK